MNHKKPFSKHKGRKKPEDLKRKNYHAAIDLRRVKRCAALFFKDWEIAAVLDIGKTTFADAKAVDPKIQEAIDQGREIARGNIRRLQFQKAMKGDSTMLIWIGKQELDQKDKTELSNDPKHPVTFTLSIGNKDIKES